MTESVFTKIVKRELPAEIVYEDDTCLALMDIKPNAAGQVVLVPKEQVEQWLELEQPLLNHLTKVAQSIGHAQMAVYKPRRVELALVGLDVDHVHMLLIPINGVEDTDFAKAQELDRDRLAAEGQKIREALKGQEGTR